MQRYGDFPVGAIPTFGYIRFWGHENASKTRKRQPQFRRIAAAARHFSQFVPGLFGDKLEFST